MEENAAEFDIPFPEEENNNNKNINNGTQQVNSHPPSPSHQGNQKIINAVANIKIPSMTQVYDLASSVGTCIEPLNRDKKKVHSL